MFVCDASLCGLGCSTFYWQAQNNGRWPKLVHLQSSQPNNPGHRLPSWTWEESERLESDLTTCFEWANVSVIHAAQGFSNLLKSREHIKTGRIDCFDCSGRLNLPRFFLLFLVSFFLSCWHVFHLLVYCVFMIHITGCLTGYCSQCCKTRCRPTISLASVLIYGDFLTRKACSFGPPVSIHLTYSDML